MWQFLSEVVCTLFFLFFIRIFIVYSRIHQPNKVISRRQSPTAKTMIIMGSGGHTFEMIRLIKDIGEKYRPRVYVIAESDEMSEKQIVGLEETFEQQDSDLLFKVERIPRSREVLQSWISSIFSTFYSTLCSIAVVYRHMPDVILCNGPGTCVPICLAAYFLHVICLKHIKCIYVESICRVESLSLSGKILYHMADYCLVQWPELKVKYPRCKYLGRLI